MGHRHPAEPPGAPLAAGPAPGGARLGPGESGGARGCPPRSGHPGGAAPRPAAGGGCGGGCPMAESNHNNVDSLLSLEGCLQLLSSQMEDVLEGLIENISALSQITDGLVQGNSLGEIRQDFLLLPELPASLLEDRQVATSSRGQDPSSSHHNISFTQTLYHCFGPPDAMLLRTDYPTRSNSETRHLQRQASFPQTSSDISNPESPPHGLNLTGLFSAADIRNLTAHDDNFDESKLMSLALEEGFDPIDVSQLFEEPGSDLGLSLNSSHSTASDLVCSEGAVGYSSDVKSVSLHGLGAVGGRSQEHSKYGHVEYPGDSECSREATFQQFLHNHTYNQLPSQTAATLEHQQQPWIEKPNEVKDRCHNTIDTDLSSNECGAKALRIPFSVDEIVSMPVDSFNTMLAKNHLTDTQVSLLRDIRRRGKNKVAAQNCRKRKLNAILDLEEDVSNLQTQKESLKKELSQCSRSISRMKQKLNNLYRDIFSRLRDDHGRPVNPYQYIIHCGSDGGVFIIPKHLVKSEQKQDDKKEQKQK
ncbi:nuclear factor erythroid 2-related factor 3 isoform X2 [Phalacrocorax aristotelis]|uniref:nuclear factor erythroid 2-related factor 3 isoform X2 n=1 Tax=Phalacrocorax aristotelis TaxID=126867 RepID=UPI003F4BC8D1